MTSVSLNTLPPYLIAVVWCASGQWEFANDESRAWLVGVVLVGVAAAMPLPHLRAHSFGGLREWGWVLVAGLIATS